MTAQREVVRDEAGSRFLVRVDGEEAGYAEYEREGGALRFTHTVVAPEREGQGLGSALLEGALRAAREEGVQVLPQCSFVRAHLLRHPEHLDLVPADRHEDFGLPGHPPAPA